MVQRNIRFMTTSIVGLMTIRMGEKMHLLIEGEEEHLADSYFEKFDCTPVTIPFS